MIGHSEIREALEKNLPRVTLLLGPKSIGKWTLAEHLRKHHEFTGLDVARVYKLTADRAREITEFSTRAGVGTRKLAIIQLDDATERAQNILLKSLEDSEAYFILVSSIEPLPTIVSRAALYRMGLLSDEEVARVIRFRAKLNDAEAERLAHIGHGSVARALAVLDGKTNKGVVVRALAAVHDHDAAALEELAPKWDDNSTELLRTWATEAITGRWSVFLAEESQFQGVSFPVRLLAALRHDVRPKLMVRAVLMSMI